MPKSLFASTGFLNYVINGTSMSIPNSLWVSLHTATLTTASNQKTSECTYQGYARAALPSPVISNGVATFGAITFPTCTNNVSQTATYWAIGTDQSLSNTGQILWYGPINIGNPAIPSSINIIQNGLNQMASITITES